MWRYLPYIWQISLPVSTYLAYIWQIAPDSLTNLPYIVELEAENLHPRSHFVGRYAGREPLTILPVASSRHIR